MNRKRSQLQAYFAGIFDGEGHIGIRETKSQGGYSSWVAVATIAMNDPQAVMLMAREYPEALVYQKTTNDKPTWQVLFSQHNAYRFLLEILPFLLIKHSQAKVALSFIAHRRRDHVQGWQKGQPRGTKMPECLRCARAAKSLLDIRAEVKGMNSVNALLDHEMREYRAKPEEVANDVAIMVAKLRELQEGVETRLSESNKAISVPEQDIVHDAA